MINDDQVLKIKAKIEEAEKSLKAIQSPTWRTKVSFKDNGTTYNLHTTRDTTQVRDYFSILLNKYNCLRQANVELNLTTPILLDGYSIEDWKLDCLMRIDIINKKETQGMVDDYKKFLEDKLSPEYKVGQKLSEIEDFLKNL